MKFWILVFHQQRVHRHYRGPAGAGAKERPGTDGLRSQRKGEAISSPFLWLSKKTVGLFRQLSQCLVFQIATQFEILPPRGAGFLQAFDAKRGGSRSLVLPPAKRMASASSRGFSHVCRPGVSDIQPLAAICSRWLSVPVRP